MPAFVFDHISDDTLLADLAALVATDRRTTAALLAHLAEVEKRELYLPAACSSMFIYATRVLHLSEDAAFKRIRAARIARRFPQILDALADGRVHLSGVLMLAPHLNEDNVEEILATATHRTRTELEELVARLAPRPDVPTSLVRIDPGTGELPELAPGPPPAPAADPELAPGPPPAPEKTRTRPLAPERYALEVTIGKEIQDKLVRAQALLRHRNPGGGLAEVIDRALDALLAKLEKEKFGETDRPRKAKARGADADARSVPREVQRAVHARDGEQCTFVSDDGRRCTERGFIELDHRTPVALGGRSTVEGIRVLCHAHNQYEAERLLGAAFVREKRASRRRRAARTVSAPSSAPDRDAGPEPERACGDAGGQGRDDVADAVGLDLEVTLAMRGMGSGAGETSRAMESAKVEASTFETRPRGALASWRTARGSRCSEGTCDAAAARLSGVLASAQVSGTC